MNEKSGLAENRRDKTINKNIYNFIWILNEEKKKLYTKWLFFDFFRGGNFERQKD